MESFVPVIRVLIILNVILRLSFLSTLTIEMLPQYVYIVEPFLHLAAISPMIIK